MSAEPKEKQSFLKGLGAMLKGMSITFKYLFKPAITVSYPEEKRKIAPRFKGKHWLRLHPDGMERCVGCLACMEVCPSQAILVVPADNPADKPISKAKKYSADFQINYLRCIFDGACEEACPVDAIILSTSYELSGYSREELIYRKDRLNEPNPGASGIDVNWSRRPVPAPKSATPAGAAPTPAAAPKTTVPATPATPATPGTAKPSPTGAPTPTGVTPAVSVTPVVAKPATTSPTTAPQPSAPATAAATPKPAAPVPTTPSASSAKLTEGESPKA